mgnify:CR=1 FL=1
MKDGNKNINISENNLFAASDCLTLEELLGYSEERFSGEDRFRVEKHLLDCELCSLALENLPAFESKEKIRGNVQAINQSIREQAASGGKEVQDVQKALFLTAFLGAMQRAMKYRYLKYGTAILAAFLIIAVSVVTFNALQKPTFHEIPVDNGQTRSTTIDFFSGLENLPSDSPAADKFLAKAQQLNQTTQYDSILVYFTKAAELYETTNNWERYVRCNNALAEYSRVIGNYDQAANFIASAIEIGQAQLGKNHPEVQMSYRIKNGIPPQ